MFILFLYSIISENDWLSVEGNKIVDSDGKEVWITGLNWFGYATGTGVFDGVWNSRFEEMIQSIADHGFNIIRTPFSVEILLGWAKGVYPDAHVNLAANPELEGLNSLEIFDYFLDKATENGLKIFIDIHCTKTDAQGHMKPTWYGEGFTTEDWIDSLVWITQRYKDNDVLLALDLKNEPHGNHKDEVHAIWNNGNAINNWKYAAEQAAAKVLEVNPNLLIFVEGIEYYPKDPKANGDFKSTNGDDYYFNWWGGNLRGVKDYPVDLKSFQNKLVYSPHDYGPSVSDQPWFKGGFTCDSLMSDCWHDNWFYIYDQGIAPLIIGEWGGHLEGDTQKWLGCLKNLIVKNHIHHTFWCLNSNSGDTGGLLQDDWKTWDTTKYDFIKETLWQRDGKFVGLSSTIPLGKNGIVRNG